MGIPTALLEGPLVARNELEATIGWKLRPEGLCQDDQCVPVADTSALFPEGDHNDPADLIDVRAVADLVGRPWVLDDESNLVAIGAPRSARHQAINDLSAPGFSLPDLNGVTRSLSDYAGKKKLLFAFSSW